jgi:outer membrane murein-binding lipoprotein Lpp
MEQALIEGLNSKIETLISMYEACKSENARLEATLESYQDKLLARNTTIEELKTQIDQLKLKNKNLQLVDAFNISANDRARAKRSVEKIIQEIDNCIAMLNM